PVGVWPARGGGAAAVEPGPLRPPLVLLHFPGGGGAPPAGKFLHELAFAPDAVSEIRDRERVIVRRIVGPDRVEICRDQERGPARNRHPCLRSLAAPGEGRAVRRRDPGFLPLRDAAIAQ